MLEQIALYVGICKTAANAGQKALHILTKKRLSAGERELLTAASSQGEMKLLSVDQIPGVWIRANGKDFCDEQDPAYAARYLDAFRSLCGRGFVYHEAGSVFRLTGRGFQKARTLVKK